jgi:hypothetical protein
MPDARGPRQSVSPLCSESGDPSLPKPMTNGPDPKRLRSCRLATRGTVPTQIWLRLERRDLCAQARASDPARAVQARAARDPDQGVQGAAFRLLTSAALVLRSRAS